MRPVYDPTGLFDSGDGKPQEERRRHGRLRCERTACSLGQIVDISASGLQVVCKGKRAAAGERLTLTLGYDDQWLTVDVEVARIVKTGFRRYQYGLSFVDLTDESRQMILQFAQVVSDRFMVYRASS